MRKNYIPLIGFVFFTAFGPGNPIPEHPCGSADLDEANPRAILWISGSPVWEDFLKASPDQMGKLKNMGVGIDLFVLPNKSGVRTINYCERLGYPSTCWDWDLIRNLRISKGLNLYALIGENHLSPPCDPIDTPTVACRNPDAWLRMIAEIAKLSVDGKLVFTGLINDEPAQREAWRTANYGSAWKKSIFNPTHPGKLLIKAIRKVKNREIPINPNFKFVHAEPMLGWLTDYGDVPEAREDIFSNYWYLGDKRMSDLKAYATSIQKKWGMWVDKSTYEGDAARTCYNGGTVIFLFGNGLAPVSDWKTLRDSYFNRLF